MGNHCNSYGFHAGFGALCAFISWYIIQERHCGLAIKKSLFDDVSTDTLQTLHYIVMVVGVVLFVLSFFNFAGVLYDVSILFVAASIGIFAAGVLMCYGAYLSFFINCKGGISNLADSLAGNINVFTTNDPYGITVFVLDILAALSLIGAALSFSRTF